MSEKERAITLCNSGVMAARAADMFDWIDATGNENASGEYYQPIALKSHEHAVKPQVA